jgi:hypothetical protein
MSADPQVSFSASDAKRVSDVVRRTEVLPEFSPSAGGFSDVGADSLECWVQPSSDTPSSSSPTTGYYPGNAWVHLLGSDSPWTQSGTIWINPPNGETLTTDEYYRGICCGTVSASLGSNTPVFDAIVPGGTPLVTTNNTESDLGCSTVTVGAGLSITFGQDSGNPGNDTLTLALTLSNAGGGVVDNAASSITFNGLNLTKGSGANTGNDTVGAAGSNTQVQYNFGGAMKGDSSFTYTSGVVQIGVTTGGYVQISASTGHLVVYEGGFSSNTFSFLGGATGGPAGAAASFKGGNNGSGALCIVNLCDLSSGSQGYAVDAIVGGINADSFSGFSCGGTQGVSRTDVIGSVTMTFLGGIRIA